MTPKGKPRSARAGIGRTTPAAEAVPHPASRAVSCSRSSGCDSAPIRKPRAPKVRGTSEHDHAVALMRAVRMATARHPELSLLYAIPNGGHRSKVTAGKLKAEGVRPGIPDYHLPVARGGWHSLYVELKTETGRASREQVETMRALEAAGNRCVVARGWNEALDALLHYLEGKA